MDPVVIGTVLLVLGIVCLLLEAKIPGFFIAIPGTVLVLLGTIGLLVPSLLLSVVSPIIAVVGALGASALSIRFYKALSSPSAPVTSTPEGLVGEMGTVVKAFGPDGRGRVRVRGQIWSSTCAEALPAGKRVLVLGTEDGLLVVSEPPDALPSAPRAALAPKKADPPPPKASLPQGAEPPET